MSTEEDDQRLVTEPQLSVVMTELTEILNSPLTTERFERWKVIFSDDLFLFSSTLIGSIIWKKPVGRILSPSLASAFTITIFHWQTVLVGSPGGPAKFVDLKVPHLEPPKWDGPSDEEYYRVTFAAGGLEKGTKYFIGVSFSDQAKWESEFAGKYLLFKQRRIEPAARAWEHDGPSVLEPFEVVVI